MHSTHSPHNTQSTHHTTTTSYTSPNSHVSIFCALFSPLSSFFSPLSSFLSALLTPTSPHNPQSISLAILNAIPMLPSPYSLPTPDSSRRPSPVSSSVSRLPTRISCLSPSSPSFSIPLLPAGLYCEYLSTLVGAVDSAFDQNSPTRSSINKKFK